MSSNTYALKQFKAKILVSNGDLSIEPESVPVHQQIIGQSPDPRVFFKTNGEEHLFWDHGSKTFTRDRVRPHSMIGTWRNHRKIQIAFLEKFTNVQASKFHIDQIAKIFNDEGWNPIFSSLQVND